MKTTYLMKKVQSDGSVRLSVVSSTEWLSVVNGNKGLPIEQRRYFVLDYIADGNNLDCMIIETSLAEYREWDRGRLVEKRNRRTGQMFRNISLDTLIGGSECSGYLSDLITASPEVETVACDRVLMDELKKALKAWKPWGNDMLEMYLNGQKRICTKILAEELEVSPQVVRKYKRQFEEFVKKFLGVFRFDH